MLLKRWSARRPRMAFTLIEMLTVIAVIGTLAALILAALGPAKTNALKTLCQTDEKALTSAIETYYSTYGLLPASTNALAAANGNDFTFGTSLTGGGGQLSGMPVIPGAPSGIVTANSSYQNNNSELIAILRDDIYYPEYATNGGQVQGHIYNNQQTSFYTGKLAAVPNAPGAAVGSPGVGTDDILRDPWGLPYMVTLDLNGDNRVLDPYLNQMYANQFPGSTLWIPGHEVVWSLGPYAQHVNFTLGSMNSVNKSIAASY